VIIISPPAPWPFGRRQYGASANHGACEMRWLGKDGELSKLSTASPKDAWIGSAENASCRRTNYRIMHVRGWPTPIATFHASPSRTTLPATGGGAAARSGGAPRQACEASIRFVRRLRHGLIAIVGSTAVLSPIARPKLASVRNTT